MIALRMNKTVQQDHSMPDKQKTQMYFYTSNEHEYINTKMKSTIPFRIEKNVKYLCVNLTK